VDRVAARERAPSIVALGIATCLARSAEAAPAVRRIGGARPRAATPPRVPGPRAGRQAA